MANELIRISLDKLAAGNRLFLDYVHRSGGTDQFLPSASERFAAWGGGAGQPPAPLDATSHAGWKDVIDDVTKLSRLLGAADPILDKLARAGSREARFVVTGQQPGALGGPLYTIYKIVTTIAVADRIEKLSGQVCIPLYWCGADDTDFGEIRDVHMLTRGLAIVSSSIAQTAYTPGMPVGDIDTKPLSDVWNNLATFAGEHARGNAVRDIVDQSFGVAADHGQHAAAILVRLLGGRIAVVDGRSAAVRRFSREIIRRYAGEESAIKEQVVEAGRNLEASGYHSQLSVGRDSGVFLMENGRRHSVSEKQRARLEDAVANHIEACSPGVILRNLVQDYTFEPLAVVLGPAEIAYRAQISGLYDRFDIKLPLCVPRMAATFVPPALTEVVNLDGGAGAELLVTDPPAFTARTYRTLTPKPLRDSAVTFDADVKKALDRLTKEVDSQLPDKARGKLRGRIRDVSGRVDQLGQMIGETGRTRALERWPFLAELGRLIRPGEQPQERRLTVMAPFLYSSNAADDLVDLASTHVADLMDSRVEHVVYSAQP